MNSGIERLGAFRGRFALVTLFGVFGVPRFVFRRAAAKRGSVALAVADLI